METKVFENFGYTVVANIESHFVDYKIYEIVGSVLDDNEKEVPAYGNNYSETLENVDVVISGSVKWDGCSNWLFEDTRRNHMTHGCTREDLLNIGNILAACWDWTAELLDTWDSQVTGL